MLETNGFQTWIDILSLIGSIASIIGIPLSLWQIFKIKSNTDASRKAIEETKGEIQRVASISDLAKVAEIIKHIQDSISEQKDDIALFRLKELKSIIIELKERPILDSTDFKEKISRHIVTIGADIINLHNLTLSVSTQIKRDIIVKHLEQVSDIIIEAQSRLKYQDYEKQ